MEFFTYFSFVVLGIALGVGGDWLFWQKKFREANERVKQESKAVGMAFNEQIEAKDGQLASLGEEFATVRSRLETDLGGARREVTELRQQLAEAEQGRGAAERTAARIPELENQLAERQQTIDGLTAAREELQGRLAELEEALAEERRALEDGLVFVQGSHYLPASVVRHLTRGHEEEVPAAAAPDEE